MIIKNLQEGATVLHYACEKGNVQMSEILIQAGANLDSQSPVCFLCDS